MDIVGLVDIALISAYLKFILAWSVEIGFPSSPRSGSEAAAWHAGIRPDGKSSRSVVTGLPGRRRSGVPEFPGIGAAPSFP